MDYKEILDTARKSFDGKCHVCKVCNGEACRGRTPGCGAKGTGESFVASANALKKIRIRMDNIYSSVEIDTKIDLFGKSFGVPVFCAPLGGVSKHFGTAISDDECRESLILGTIAANSLTFTGDGPDELVYNKPLELIKANGGLGVPTIKPWEFDVVAQKIALAEQSGAVAIAMDIDAGTLPLIRKSGAKLINRDTEELKKVIGLTKLPFIVKGIMTPGAALKAKQAGAYGIVISNHGGRSVDFAQGTTEVIAEIKEVVGDSMKIFVDGAIRTGVDVFKVLALGADAVLIGRPYIFAAYGAKKDGVEMYTNKIKDELIDVMRMTACKNLNDITADKVVYSF